MKCKQLMKHLEITSVSSVELIYTVKIIERSISEDKSKILFKLTSIYHKVMNYNLAGIFMFLKCDAIMTTASWTIFTPSTVGG